MTKSEGTARRSSGPSGFAVMTTADWLLICMIAAFFFLFCVLRSKSRLLWNDELLGYRVVDSPSLSGMIKGWYEGADGGGILYYLAVRLFTDLFGLSALTLRLFSAAGMVASVVLVWCAARRYASTLVVACAVGLVYFIPAAMRWQEVNGRFYGFFLASAALASLWFLVTADRDPLPLDLAITAFAHACLIGGHILGLVYSFCLIAGMLALGAIRGRLRWRLYLSAAAAWILVPLSYHAIRSSAAIGANVFWTQRPHLSALFDGITISDSGVMIVVIALSVSALLWRLLSTRRPAVPAFRRSLDLPAIMLISSLFLAELLLFVKSQFGTSIYADRYLLPVSFGTTLIVAALLTFVLPGGLTGYGSQGRSFALSAVVLLLFFYSPVSHRFDYGELYPLPGYPQRVMALLPPGSPVIVTQVAVFQALTTYDKTGSYFYLLDRKYDHDPAHPRGDLYGARMMEAWKRAGYESGHILPCPEILNRYPHFNLILSSLGEGWFRDRLLHNPAYQVKPLGSTTEWTPVTVWTVDRKYPSPPPC